MSPFDDMIDQLIDWIEDNENSPGLIDASKALTELLIARARIKEHNYSGQREVSGQISTLEKEKNDLA